MTPTEYGDCVQQHIRGFFVGHDIRIRHFDRGPTQRLLRGFHVMEVSQGPRLARPAYISVGLSFPDGTHTDYLEFVTVAPEPSERHVELLALTANYHLTGERLGLGHTFPIGEPWTPGSNLDHMLVSLPYPFGPELESLVTAGHEARILWLPPITKAELEYKKRKGIRGSRDALRCRRAGVLELRP